MIIFKCAHGIYLHLLFHNQEGGYLFIINSEIELTGLRIFPEGFRIYFVLPILYSTDRYFTTFYSGMNDIDKETNSQSVSEQKIEAGHKSEISSRQEARAS